MRALAEAWPEPEMLQSLIAKLPWRHNLSVLDRIKDGPTREWYLRAALEYGWSQDVLVLQIKSRLHVREGKAVAFDFKWRRVSELFGVHFGIIWRTTLSLSRSPDCPVLLQRPRQKHGEDYSR